MKTKQALLLFMTALLLPLAALAQEAPKPAPVGRVVPLKIQVVFSEYEGEKKVGSLPYVLNHNGEVARETRTSLRMGIRVPITTKEGQIQYQSVGTDIDAFVRPDQEGNFRTTFELRRSSVYAPPADAKSAEWKPAETMHGNPFLREFSGRFDALLRDGQTTQTTLATDPVSGRTLRVDVTLTVIK